MNWVDTIRLAIDAGFDLNGMSNMLYSVRCNYAQLQRFAELVAAFKSEQIKLANAAEIEKENEYIKLLEQKQNTPLPIESAPSDGTVVLGYCNGDWLEVYCCGPGQPWHWNCFMSNDTNWTPNPTHWMPRPLLPGEQKVPNSTPLGGES